MAEITLLTNWKILWGLTASKINESNCVTIKVWVSLPLSRHILHLGKQVRDSNPKFLDDYLPNSQPTTRISICLKIFLHTKLVFPFFTQNVSVKGVFKNCGGIFRNQSNTHFFNNLNGTCYQTKENLVIVNYHFHLIMDRSDFIYFQSLPKDWISFFVWNRAPARSIR